MRSAKPKSNQIYTVRKIPQTRLKQLPRKSISTKLSKASIRSKSHFTITTSSFTTSSPLTTSSPTNIAPLVHNPLHQYSPSHFFEHLSYLQPYEYQLSLKTHSPDGIPILAQAIAQFSAQHPTLQLNILLYGDLGVGKTTFSRSFLRTLANAPALNVVSPTFTLQNYYRLHDRMVNHCDLYRLQHADETAILNLIHSYEDHCVYPQYAFNATSIETNNLSNLQTSQDTQVTSDFKALLQTHQNVLQSLPDPNIIHSKLPNRPLTGAQVNLLEWPHILHNSPQMPQSFLRIDIHDHIYYKIFDVSISGKKWTVPVVFADTYQNNHDTIDCTNNDTKAIVSTLGLELTQQIYSTLSKYNLLDKRYTSDRLSTVDSRQAIIKRDLKDGVKMEQILYDQEEESNQNQNQKDDELNNQNDDDQLYNEPEFNVQQFSKHRLE